MAQRSVSHPAQIHPPHPAAESSERCLRPIFLGWIYRIGAKIESGAKHRRSIGPGCPRRGRFAAAPPPAAGPPARRSAGVARHPCLASCFLSHFPRCPARFSLRFLGWFALLVCPSIIAAWSLAPLARCRLPPVLVAASVFRLPPALLLRGRRIVARGPCVWRGLLPCVRGWLVALLVRALRPPVWVVRLRLRCSGVCLAESVVVFFTVQTVQNLEALNMIGFTLLAIVSSWCVAVVGIVALSEALQ